MHTHHHTTRLSVQREPFMGDRFVFLYHGRRGDKFFRADPLKLDLLDITDPLKHVTPEPTFTLSPEEAQALIDDLWTAGLRPTAGHGSTGQLAATEKHLADLKTIAFKLLDHSLSEPPQTSPQG